MAKNTKKAEQAVEMPKVMCVVLERFKDKEINDVRRKGEVIMVTEERFAELTEKKQWVAKVEPPEEEKAADDGEADGDTAGK